MVGELLECVPEQFGRDIRTVRADEDGFPDAIGKRFLEGSLHAAAEVAGPLRNTGEIAARVTVSVRRIVLHLSSSCPYQALFRRVAATLVPDFG
jgi:hypothetical protein